MGDSFKGVFPSEENSCTPWTTEKPRWACLIYEMFPQRGLLCLHGAAPLSEGDRYRALD